MMEEPFLSGLDAALHELGMLSTVTESRKDYLKEQVQHRCNANRQALNVLHMNTRFVTDVVIGRRKRRTFRYEPYPGLMAREERTRTKSENSDIDVGIYIGSSLSPLHTPEKVGLYKSRSLENVKVTVSDDDDKPTQEVESVSDQIQHLQVCE